MAIMKKVAQQATIAAQQNRRQLPQQSAAGKAAQQATIKAQQNRGQLPQKPAGGGLVRGATNAIKGATAQVKATGPMGSGKVQSAVANVKRSLKK